MPSTAEQRPSGSAPVLALDLGGHASAHRRGGCGRDPHCQATHPLAHGSGSRCRGDSRAPALDIIARALRVFAAAIVSIVNMFDPDRIIVGGGIAMAWGERLLAPARDAVEAHAFRVQASRVRIVPTALGDDVALVGALPLVAFAV